MIFERAWHCREMQHSLGLVRGEAACGGWQGMFDGWALPVASAASASDYRAEIMQQVVDPCYLDMALRNPIDGVTPEKLAELAKLSVGDAVDEMVTAIQQIVRKADRCGGPQDHLHPDEGRLHQGYARRVRR